MKFGKKICSQILRTVTIAALALNVAVPAQAAMDGKLAEGYTYKEVKKDTQGGKYAPVYYDTSFYGESDPLYAATHFHIFALEDVQIGTHTNGNIATKYMSFAGADSGTRDFAPMEISYVKDFSSINNNILCNPQSVLVVGPDVGVKSYNNDSGIMLKGTGMTDYTGMDVAHVKNIYQEIKGGDEFIDMDGEFAKLRSMSKELSEIKPNGGVTFDFQDENTRKINVDMSQNAYTVINLDKSVIEMGRPLRLAGYDKNGSNSVIINVDLADAGPDFNVNSVVKYITTDGDEIGNKERVSWEYGRVLWNFYDSSAKDGCYSGNIVFNATFLGTVLAPDAKVEATQNLDGSVICTHFVGSAETHRNDFTGIMPVLLGGDDDDNDTTADTTTKETTTVTTTETTTETTTFTTTTQKETDTETTSEEKSDDTTDTETDSKDEPSSQEPSGDDTTEPDTEDESKDTEDESKDTEDSSKDTEDSSKDTEDSSKDTEDSSKDTEDSSQATTECGNISDEPAETESEELTETTSEELTETTSEELTQTTTDKDNTDKDNDDDDDSSNGSSSSSSHRGGGSSGGSSSHKADSRAKDETVKNDDDDEKTTSSDEDTEVTTQEDESTSVSVEENDNTVAGPDDTVAPDDDTDVYVPGTDTQDVDNVPDSDNAAYSDSAADNSLSESGISVSSDSASKGNVDTLSLNANDSDANSVMQNDSDADSVNPKLNDSDSLPQTGLPVNTALLCLVGLAAVGIGMFLVFRSRKKSVR